MKRFVEIGASHYPELSHLLAKREACPAGWLPEWHGVFVEPAPANLVELLRKLDTEFETHNNYEVIAGAVARAHQLEKLYARSWQELTCDSTLVDVNTVPPYTGEMKKWQPEHVNITHQGQALYVPTFTLDTLLDTLQIDYLHILRLDIEGVEYDVLKDYSWRILPEKVMVEPHEYLDRNSTCEKFNALLEPLGYTWKRWNGHDYEYELENCTVSDVERIKHPWEQ